MSSLYPQKTRRLFRLMLITIGLSSIIRADGIDQTVLKTQSDIKVALEELNTLRAKIDTERVPLAAEHSQLSQAVSEKRETLKRMREAQLYSKEQQRALNASVTLAEAECQFILTALTEYRRGIEARTSTAALQSCREKLDACDVQLAKAETFKQLPEATAQLLELGIHWNQNCLGGHQEKGTALNAAGIEESGAFQFFGPLGYFSSSNGSGGLVLTRFGSLSPTYYDRHTSRDRGAIANLVNKRGHESVPLDVTQGDALSIEEAGDSIVEQIGKGGFVMVPLLLIGLLAIALTLWKFFELRGMRFASHESLSDVIANLAPDAAEQAIQSARSLHPPLSTLIEAALVYRDVPREHLEEILHEHILAMVPRLERHLGTLAVFGGVAPLLGLLGTVTGMIHTFDLVAIFGTGEARLLSGGISEALITTKFGLAIAIPVLLVHAFFSRRVRTLVGTLENTAVRFVNILKTGNVSS